MDIGAVFDVYPRVRGEAAQSILRWARSRVYPRVRGEAACAHTGSRPSTGLSPRPRGSLLLGGRREVTRGSIPASAGKPIPTPTSTVTTWVYPRVRGEAKWTMPGGHRAEGLSPRPRGSPDAPGWARPSLRSIPASAGKPSTRPWEPSSSRVYPRVRGEAWWPRTPRSPRRGLSPRPRGSHRVAHHDGLAAGSIPASAGKPNGHHLRHRDDRVYPRVRGEAMHWIRRSRMSAGLSPRPRGSHPTEWSRSPHPGSIPASAGKPTVCALLDLSKRVYPRVRGEAGPRRGSAS